LRFSDYEYFVNWDSAYSPTFIGYEIEINRGDGPENVVIAETGTGAISDGWGEVSYWPRHRVEIGDWTAAIWRSPTLADAAARFTESSILRPLQTAGLSGHSTGQQLRGGAYPRATAGTAGAFRLLDGKGAAEHTTIEATPNAYRANSKGKEAPILKDAGHLLVTAGQRTSTGRITAVASTEKYVGNGWIPVSGLKPTQAKALAVFSNATAGRLLLMRNPGRTLAFPSYEVAVVESLLIPDISDARIVETLAACWESTRTEIVPQFRDGYTSVRRIWDEAVCDALGWDINEIVELGELLAAEPYVKGTANSQWKP